VIEDGVSGITSTDPSRLMVGMEELLADHGLARQMGRIARAVARERFSIERFAHDWTNAFEEAVGRPSTAARSHPRHGSGPISAGILDRAAGTPATISRDAR
jgi:hypothetical protein